LPLPTTRRTQLRVVKALIVAGILTYGASLRLIAITEIYGPVAQPRWLAATQTWATGHVWRPGAMRWEPAGLYSHLDAAPTHYRSDPYTYLQYARDMRSFYAAHRREPLYPFATKVSLLMLSDQDVAVSFASAAFSVLAIAATLLLGTVAFGFPVGAAAAVLMAIEYELISWGVDGGRDEAFMSGVLLVSAAALWLARFPGWRSATALGVSAAAVCLIRITSLSFVVPALMMVALVPGGEWGRRLRATALASATGAVLIAPFLVNCWRVYGDPLYSINVHATVYRETEGRPGDPSLTAREFLQQQFRTRPMRTLDTVSQGLTAYPFANKWTGFERWHPAAGGWLSTLAVAGLIAFAGSLQGRMLLLILVASLVPYAATWRLIADWRFTEHAYPFFLIAASLAVVSCIGGLLALRNLDRARVREARGRAAWIGAAAAAAVAAWYVASRVLPVAVAKETLAAGEPAIIMALERDRPFFSDDWKAGPPGGIPTRVAAGARGVIRLPLPEATAYEILVRVDGLFDEADTGTADARIQMLLNGRLLARCDPGTTSGRFGTCRVLVPAEAVRAGMNHLTLATDQERGRGLRVWYIRIEPTTRASLNAPDP
jgi:hypothetical protein